MLGTRGLPREEYFAELAPRLRRVIDSDATCWHTLDPQTLLLTGDEPADLVERGIFTAETASQAGELIVRSEYVVEDRNTFAELASRRVPVGILAQATRGRPERSARYRDLLVPAGIPHEMRAAFVIRGRVWGAVHIARRDASGPFTRRDVDALARVGGAIAHGIRGSLRFDAARRAAGSEAPGLIVLDTARRSRAGHRSGAAPDRRPHQRIADLRGREAADRDRVARLVRALGSSRRRERRQRRHRPRRRRLAHPARDQARPR